MSTITTTITLRHVLDLLLTAKNQIWMRPPQCSFMCHPDILSGSSRVRWLLWVKAHRWFDGSEPLPPERKSVTLSVPKRWLVERPGGAIVSADLLRCLDL